MEAEAEVEVEAVVEESGKESGQIINRVRRRACARGLGLRSPRDRRLERGDTLGSDLPIRVRYIRRGIRVRRARFNVNKFRRVGEGWGESIGEVYHRRSRKGEWKSI